jgi:hypothetical protein
MKIIKINLWNQGMPGSKLLEKKPKSCRQGDYFEISSNPCKQNILCKHYFLFNDINNLMFSLIIVLENITYLALIIGEQVRDISRLQIFKNRYLISFKNNILYRIRTNRKNVGFRRKRACTYFEASSPKA